MSQPTQIINLFSKQPIVVGVLVQIIYISNLRSHAPLFGNYLFQHSKQLFCKWLPYHYKSVLFQLVVGNARTSLLCIMALYTLQRNADCSYEWRWRIADKLNLLQDCWDIKSWVMQCMQYLSAYNGSNYNTWIPKYLLLLCIVLRIWMLDAKNRTTINRITRNTE